MTIKNYPHSRPLSDIERVHGFGSFKASKGTTPVDAILWTGTNYGRICDFIGAVRDSIAANRNGALVVKGMLVDVGNYIIKDHLEEFSTCNPEEFKACYIECPSFK